MLRKGTIPLTEPTAGRPYMPGYGIEAADAGGGLLPWSWAQERLAASHDYWLATVWPDGRPHVMPVWGAWLGECVWFSSGLRSRKARNLAADPRCVVTTDNALEPVVMEGVAERVGDSATIRTFLDATNRKYETSYELDFLDPEVNGTFRIRPTWVFALTEDDFSGSPTRWSFET